VRGRKNAGMLESEPGRAGCTRSSYNPNVLHPISYNRETPNSKIETIFDVLCLIGGQNEKVFWPDGHHTH
jgi:hypothetical protein